MRESVLRIRSGGRRAALLAWCQCFIDCEEFDRALSVRDHFDSQTSGYYALSRRAKTLDGLRALGTPVDVIVTTWREASEMSAEQRRFLSASTSRQEMQLAM